MLVRNLFLELGHIEFLPIRHACLILEGSYEFTLLNLYIFSLHICGLERCGFDSFWYTSDCIVSLDVAWESGWDSLMEVWMFLPQA